jgi:hypothetical protein
MSSILISVSNATSYARGSGVHFVPNPGTK